MPITHNKGGYTVTINDNGSILVKQGDSISKYSMAIHGDFNHLQEYLRSEGGMLKPIANINMIMAGETLFHQPSIPIGVSPIQPTLPPDYDYEKIVRDSGLPPPYYDPAARLLKGMGHTQRGIAIIGAFAAADGAFATLFAINAGIFGPILSILGSSYALWSARNFGIKQTGMRGTTYGAVAWAFNDNGPFLPDVIKKNLRDSGLSSDISYYEGTWNTAVADSKSKLTNYCKNEGLNEDAVKLVFRAGSLIFSGGSEPQSHWLAAGMLLDVADTHFHRSFERQTFLQPYSLYPTDTNKKPAYPPNIAIRYK